MGSFLTRHLGFPIPSPALLERTGLRFRRAVREFAAAQDTRWSASPKGGDHKIAVMGPYLDRLIREKRPGVAAIGVAQEFQRVFTGTTRQVGVSATLVFDAPRQARSFF